MALSRPLLLALLGLALLGATVFAVQTARNKGADDPAPVAQKAADPASAPAQAPAPAPSASKAGKLSAEQAVASILTPGTPVESGRFSLAFDTKELGGGREHDHGRVAGSFTMGDKGDLPNFDLRVKSHSEDAAGKGVSNQDVRMLIAAGDGFIGTAEDMYRVPSATMANVGKVRNAMASGPVAQLPEFQLARWLDDVKVKGVEKMDGVDATHVSGKVVAAAAAADVVRVVRAEAEASASDPALSKGVPGTAKRAVKNAQLDAWVGSDRVVRRLSVSVLFDAPKALREPGDSERWTAGFDFRLSGLNKSQGIKAPANVAPGAAAKGMGKKSAGAAQNLLAVSALAVGAPGGAVGTTWSFLGLNRVGDSAAVSRKVLRALERRQEVAVFFNNPQGLDDQATAASVRYLKGHSKKTAVFTDDVKNVRRYGRLVENLGVSQAPAIVFINRRGTASLVEGYIDGPSLVQVVADSR